MDEKGERKRKCFSGTTETEVTKKIVNYVVAFKDCIKGSNEFRKILKERIPHRFQIFKATSAKFDKLLIF